VGCLITKDRDLLVLNIELRACWHSIVPACPQFNIQDKKDLLSDLERAMNLVPDNFAEKKGA